MSNGRKFITCLCGGAMGWKEDKMKFVCDVCLNECSQEDVKYNKMVDPTISKTKKDERKMIKDKTPKAQKECKTDGCSAEAKTKSGICNRCYQREWSRNKRGKGNKKKPGKNRKDKRGEVFSDKTISHHPDAGLPKPETTDKILDSLTDGELESWIVKVLSYIKEVREDLKKQKEELSRLMTCYNERRLKDGKE